MRITIADVVAKQRAEAWAEEHGFDLLAQLEAHLREVYGEGAYEVESVEVDESFIVLLLRSDLWREAREVAIDNGGDFLR